MAASPGEDREAVIDGLLLEMRFSSWPAVVIVEDAHWADDASLDIIRHLARRIERLPASGAPSWTARASSCSSGEVSSCNARCRPTLVLSNAGPTSAVLSNDRSKGTPDAGRADTEVGLRAGGALAAGFWRRRIVRYSVVSLVSIVVSQSVLLATFGMLNWAAGPSNIAACAVATVPSYYLNRAWAWGRRGRSHPLKEVVPFWALAFIGLAFSTWAADFGSTLARQAAVSHGTATAIVMTSALLAFGVLWAGKFAIFNTVLFSSSSGSGRTDPTAGRARP